MHDLATARSLLFVPGNRPERFTKAAASGAHAVVLDLEDAVQPSEKENARAAVSAWLQAGHAAVVRINAAGTPWHADDTAMLAATPASAVMLAKADAPSTNGIAAALPGAAIIALLETVNGYMQLPRLAASPGVLRIAFGSIDFGTETGIADVGDAMSAIRTQLVLASCHAGLAAPIDGVTVAINDDAAVHADTLRARHFGFGGKLCIHPRQITAVNAAFRPSEQELDWARRVLAAITTSQGNATTVDGRMIDAPVVEQARRLLAGTGDGHG